MRIAPFQGAEAGSTPARATEHGQVAQLVDARRSERRAARHGSSNLPLVTELIAGAAGAQLAPIRPVRPVRYRGLQLRVGVGSTGSHKPGTLGATPRPATTGYANWHSGQFERLVPVGSSPTPVTEDPVVQRQRRLGDSQEDGGSSPPGITRWSAGVLAAHLLGKEEDRVRFPDGPLRWAGMFPGGD